AKRDPNKPGKGSQMKTSHRGILGFACIVLAAGLALPRAGIANEALLYVSVGEVTRPPIGWVEFCVERPAECKVTASTPRNAVLNARTWKELVRINRKVNETIKPMTDLDHYGVVEKWTYPDDGYGDCEDYVLLKRKLLMEAGWPREALLITV